MTVGGPTASEVPTLLLHPEVQILPSIQILGWFVLTFADDASLCSLQVLVLMALPPTLMTALVLPVNTSSLPPQMDVRKGFCHRFFGLGDSQAFPIWYVFSMRLPLRGHVRTCYRGGT